MGGQELARRMAVRLTGSPSPEWMTCFDVAASGRHPHTGRMGLLRPADRAAVEEAMVQMEVWELRDRDFRAVSDGQRQRVLLAAALCQQPQVLVLDEPTAFLDIRHKIALCALLRRLARERGMTVLLSLHEIELAERVSDRLVCVGEGQILQVGTPEEVFRAGAMERLYGLGGGMADPLTGSVELPRCEGEAKVFVVAGGGSGIPVYRALRRRELPFAAGVLVEQDVELPVARALAAEVVTERACHPIGERAFERARTLLLACGRAICTDFPVGPTNERQAALRQLAIERGLVWEDWRE